MSNAARRPATAQDLTRLRGVSDPQISPDGRRVAFVVTTASEERDEYLSNIWVVGADGGEPHRFTTGPTRDTHPRWSPDGKWLAFVSDRGSKKKSQLYAMPVDGGEAIQLTDLASGVYGQWGIAWSPDSTRLAFVGRVGGWQEPEREEEGAKSRPARVISTLKYRFEGIGFTHDSRPHIFVVAVAGGAPKQITDGDYPDVWPTWCPDGTRIAFVAERHDTRDIDVNDAIYEVDMDGGVPRRISSTLAPMWAPAYSPERHGAVDLPEQPERGRDDWVVECGATAGRIAGPGHLLLLRTSPTLRRRRRIGGVARGLTADRHGGVGG
jgi:Tol biopolymer transport system component